MLCIMLLLIILLLVIYIYKFQYDPRSYKKEFIDDILPTVKTGDMILFKAANNFNSLKFISYFGHVGIVYVKDNIPYIFEANGVECMNLLKHHNRRGVFMTPLRTRLQKYKGRTFIKRLNKPVEYDLREFITFAEENMFYDMDIIPSFVKKITGLEKCDIRTNCGELTYLSLIKLGILDMSAYDKAPSFSYLHTVTKLSKCDNGYYYDEPVEFIDHPFET